MQKIRCSIIAFWFGISVFYAQIPQPPYNLAFLQNEVASVYVDIHPDSLALLLGDSLYSGHEFMATVTYQSSVLNVTTDSIGFRARGNTSLASQKKSFKVDFNRFVSTQTFQGLEELNLNGEHNDVSIMRTFLAQQLMRSAGLPASRTSYVKLFVNNEYKGLYVNLEYLDDEFLDLRFPDQANGNLWKCAYGADLTWLGSNPANYTSTYELKTNKDSNDYSALVHFADVLNNSSASTFVCAIQEVFDVDLFLRNIAMEILLGQWDGYAYNKNNYYLYQRESDGKMVYLSYDLDNTFGIDWFNINWALRNVYSWAPGNQSRPLYTKLLAVPYFRDRFTFHLNDILSNVWNVSSLQAQLEAQQVLITPAAFADDFKGLDYGFSDQDFSNALQLTWGAHVKSGIIPYLQNRKTSALLQLSAYQALPNPCMVGFDELTAQPGKLLFVSDILGREIAPDTKNCIKILNFENGTQQRLYETD
ncbi:MAG: CotH kinase family protein [Crocinitomicaceae bacterium]|jgi:spore coat protein H|nr:CotH kinase family protein [Crocinitomicaceae bacterium]